MIGSKIRHDKILNDWYRKLKQWHPTNDIRRNLLYPGGEVDITDCMLEQRQTYLNTRCWFSFNNYEVKSNKHNHIARVQLDRFEAYLRRRFRDDKLIVNSYQVFGLDEQFYCVQHIDCKDGIEYRIGGDLK